MIKTIGGIKETLNTYNAQDWVRSSEFKETESKRPGNFLPIGRESTGVENGQKDIKKTFGDYLFDSINQVNQLQVDANEAIEKLATGQSQNLHETMIIVEQAELAFKTMNQIRMKVLDAYKEIMKMSI